MPPLEQWLARLEKSKDLFEGHSAQQIEGHLGSLSRLQFPDAASLLRFHECLLFLRAFPRNARLLRMVENLLKTVPLRVQKLRSRRTDMTAFEEFDGAGVAGTVMQDALSFDLARWLVRRLPGEAEIAWEDYDDERAMGSVWPRLLPLLEEDACVEANIPWQRWLRAGKGSVSKDLEWLIRAFEQLRISDVERSALYDGMRLPVRWKLNEFRFSRTGNWERPRKIFYHREPLISRRDVSLKNELARPAPALKSLSLHQGKAIIDKIREVLAVRYRELYGTTLGDPRSVVRADIGRGAVLYLWNLPPERRLPLRAYVAGFTVKNGVPINYIEAIGLCEWIEVGFNTFYTFRQGETAWIYAQALRSLVAMTGAKCISIYPYQIGQNNEEAIESGAFWFYRKLGFRPGRKDLLQLTEQEEIKIAGRTGYRTPARILRKLAERHVFYELPGSEPGAWDRFSVRNLGLRVNRRMGREFHGASAQIRGASVAAVAGALRVRPARWSSMEQHCFENWATVLALIPGLNRWVPAEKHGLVQIIRAQSARDEMRYLRLTQKHAKLRGELLRLGSTD